VLNKFGQVRPFSNIIRAEQTHAQMVKAELKRNGWSYPDNTYLGKVKTYLGKVKAPASLLEACRIGEKAEIDNIALYDRLLPKVSDAASRAVLERLQWASRENHLPAFQRCISRGGTPGKGSGGGQGRGW